MCTTPGTVLLAAVLFFQKVEKGEVAKFSKVSKGFDFLQTGLLSTSIYFKSTNTFSYLHGDSFIAKLVLKGVAVGEIVRTLHSTSCPGYFRLIKRILIRNFYRHGFPKKAIQAAKRIGFGKRKYYL